MEQHDCDESRTLFEIHAERSQNCHRFCKTFSQQKHGVLQSAAPLQLKRFKVCSKMAIVASAPVLPNQKKECCKIARFTDAPCIMIWGNFRLRKIIWIIYLFIYHFHVGYCSGLLHSLGYWAIIIRFKSNLNLIQSHRRLRWNGPTVHRDKILCNIPDD